MTKDARLCSFPLNSEILFLNMRTTTHLLVMGVCPGPEGELRTGRSRTKEPEYRAILLRDGPASVAREHSLGPNWPAMFVHHATPTPLAQGEKTL